MASQAAILSRSFSYNLHRSLQRRCMLVLSVPLSSKTNSNIIGQSENSQKGHGYKTSEGFGKFIMLIFPIGGFALGTWQVKRKKWKLGLISDLENKTTCEPIPFPQDLEGLKTLEYRPLIVRGAFDHSREFYVEPRSLITKTDKGSIDSGSLMSFKKDNMGSQVITPFFMPNQNLAILINRGFVTRDNKNPKARMQGQVEDEIELIGLLRHTEKRPPLMPKNNPDKGLWVYKDLDQMAEKTGTSPILLDAVSSVPGGPIGGQTKVTLRDEHVSYAVTWYGLSLATSIMWYFRFIK